MMKHFLIRYGVFSILAIMLIGIAVIASRYEVRTKHPATLITMPDGNCRAYVACPYGQLSALGDSFTISQTQYGDISLAVDSFRQEPGMTLLFAHPTNELQLKQSMGGNTFASGYVFVGKERLADIISRKFFFR